MNRPSHCSLAYNLNYKPVIEIKRNNPAIFINAYDASVIEIDADRPLHNDAYTSKWLGLAINALTALTGICVRLNKLEII